MIGFPKSIQIQTTTRCTRECPWCPNWKLEENMMYEDTFDAVLWRLAQAGYQGRLHLYLMAEPLTDNRMERLIKRVKEKFPDNIVFLSTNGDLLTLEMAERLIIAGLDECHICHYTNQNYDLIQELRMFPQFGHLFMEDLLPTFYNRAGHVDVGCSDKKYQCEWLWTKAYVNYEGKVILCCSDYDFEVVMGNLMVQSFEDIWHSKEYYMYRAWHLGEKENTISLCGKCNRIGGIGNGREQERGLDRPGTEV